MDGLNTDCGPTPARARSSAWRRGVAASVWRLALAVAACGGGADGATDAAAPTPDAGAARAAAAPSPDAAASADAGGALDAGVDAGAAIDAGTPTPDAGPSADAGACPPGMAGPSCQDCAPGYVDFRGVGDCIATCDVMGAIACGDNGACAMSPADGSLYCQCERGYAGVACDTCADGFELSGGACVLPSPPALGLSLWLDADEVGSLTVGASMDVQAWADRRSFIPLTAMPTTGIARPTYNPTGRNGRATVDFDGVDDQLVLSDYTGLSSTDFEIIFAGEPTGGAPTGLLGAVSGTSDWAVMIDQHESNDLRFRVRRPPGAAGGESVVVDRSAAVRPMYVVATHQTSTAMDSLAIFASDTPMEASGVSVLGAPSGTLPSPLNLRIGRTQDGRMSGRVYEILIYTRRLSVAERAQVTGYLRTKWNLP